MNYRINIRDSTFQDFPMSLHLQQQTLWLPSLPRHVFSGCQHRNTCALLNAGHRIEVPVCEWYPSALHYRHMASTMLCSQSPVMGCIASLGKASSENSL